MMDDISLAMLPNQLTCQSRQKDGKMPFPAFSAFSFVCLSCLRDAVTAGSALINLPWVHQHTGFGYSVLLSLDFVETDSRLKG